MINMISRPRPQEQHFQKHFILHQILWRHLIGHSIIIHVCRLDLHASVLQCIVLSSCVYDIMNVHCPGSTPEDRRAHGDLTLTCIYGRTINSWSCLLFQLFELELCMIRVLCSLSDTPIAVHCLNIM